MDNQPVLTTKGVTKKFGDFVAVNNVDFELENKETLGIIGPNGAGKTT
ncbi:MAG: ATP-binding cassette domain-containing protein, partial [Desulfobacterales bacterium]|nr:ATP-binding cassette domain-containing protein [Desulfobacterales bacterium]